MEAGRGVRKLPAQPGAPGVPGMGIIAPGVPLPGMGVGRGQTTNYQNGRGPSRLGNLMNSFNMGQQSNNSNINTGNNPTSLPPMATAPMGTASMQPGQPQVGNNMGPMGPSTAQQQPPPPQHPMDTYAPQGPVGPTPVNGYLPNAADGSQTTYQPSQTMTPSVYQNGQTPYQNGHTPYQNGQGPYHTGQTNYQNGGLPGQTNYQNGSLPYQQQQQIPYQQQQPEWT